MRSLPEPQVLTQVSELVRQASAERRGALWRLSSDQRQLDANVIRLPAGAEVAAHLEARLDVLLYVIDGGGRLFNGGAPEADAPTEAATAAGPSPAGTAPDSAEATTAPSAPPEQSGSEAQQPSAEGQLVGPGDLVWLPRGSRRAVAAGPDGLVYLTVHRRRPGLTIGAPAPVEREGGDAACLLHRVCAECGRLAPETDARYCSRCGTALPND
ncbi:hypothetical protein ACMA1D_29900 [Streptomyces sp. 796.1]|uniref:hypothetical protein n=1 Tax=Streptomyces sp. 796.1 TaxID=3163029 RepID=UPI0039C8C37B